MTEAPAEAAALEREMRAWRRHLHRNPEFGFEETETARFVTERLRGFGSEEIETGVGGTGVVATLRRGEGARVIALRADMDCLRIEERTNLPHASTRPGLMHACGHDGHVATLLGAAAMLARDGGCDGAVRFVVQPAEEWGQGMSAMIRDGLGDAFNGYHKGQSAENVAEQWQISRDMQDEFAVASQNKAEAAQKDGKFADEIVPFIVKHRKGDITVDADEYIRHGATMAAMQKLRPAFTKDGSVTAANASGLNDGAAGTLLMSADAAEKRGIEPLARIASYATAGLDPSIMGVGPIYASRKALEKAGWKVDDLDLVEANEAFAAQACAVNKDMGWDPAIVNVNGGAIAIGHPIGASGARVLNTLLFEMKRRDAKKGLATLCIGGGMGVAMCLERP